MNKLGKLAWSKLQYQSTGQYPGRPPARGLGLIRQEQRTDNVGERIGIYLCECGPNIKDAVDLGKLLGFAKGLKNVVFAQSFGLLCSKEGKEYIARGIQEYHLTRVVVAACSPKEHESTFKEAIKAGGLNPYLLQLANIREQCAWTIPDKELATDKAKALIAAAAKRVLHHEPLEIKEIECQTDVLVVGAGITGISAALTLAQKNRKVYLVEKLPWIGGKVARYEDLFPDLECASCVLDPVLDAVLHHEQIEVLTYSEPREALGYDGNFVVKVEQKARFVNSKTCIGCEACFDVCPVKVHNEYNEALDERKAVYTPYAGALPNVAVIDKEHCLHWREEACSACKEACPFDCIDFEARDETLELSVGAIVLATGFDTFDPKRAPQYGYGKIANVYTGLEFERLLCSTGPTGGKLLLKNGTAPQTVAIVHCVGSRTTRFHEHCSAVCCMYSLKFAHLVMEKLPGVSVKEFYSDLCLPGKTSQGFFNRLSQKDGIEFLPMKDPDSIEIVEQDAKLLMRYTDVCGRSQEVVSDMAVLATAMEGSEGAKQLAEVFDVSVGEAGFFLEGHPHMAPISSDRQGVFIAGCAQGPKDIQTSVAQGQAAAGAILSRLIPGEHLTLEPTIAEVDEKLCSGCKICIGLCPYRAITYDYGEAHVSINEVLCRGCGICPAACPSGAIKAKHFTDEEISAEIAGLLQGW